MAKEVWALDLGEWSLKIARGHLDKKSDSMELSLYDEIRYDTLDVEEDASSLEKYAAGLQEFQNLYEVSPGDDLCVAVSGSEVFSRFINLPPVPESISEIISYEARQQIPFDIDDVVWDYQPLKEEHQPGEEIEVGLFALKRENIDELMDLLEPWRHNLRVIQNGPLAVYNFLVYEEYVDEPTIVLDMGASSTDVLVVNHPRFWLRPLLIGGNGITERLQSHFGVSWHEAERIKERASQRERQAQLLRVVRPVVGNMLSEIQRSLGYYKSLAKGVQIQKILAIGGAFELRGLDRVLADGLQYEVVRLSELRNFDLSDSVNAEEFRSNLSGACTVLGLLVQGAGREHIGINLVPEELASATALRRKKPWLAGAVAALLLVVGIFWYSEWSYGNEISGEIDRGEKIVREVERLASQFRSAQSEAEEVEGKVESLAQRAIQRDMILEVVPSLVHALPENTVFVRNLDLVWMEQANFQEALEAERGELERVAGVGEEEAGEEGVPGPGGMPGGPGGYGPGTGAPEGGTPGGVDEYGGYGGAYGDPYGGYGAPAAGAEAEGAQFGEDSVLVLRLACESTVIGRAVDYLKNEVIAPLVESRLRKDGRKVFSQVELVGTPQIVLRRSRDGKLITSPEEGEEITRFVAFRVLARVNLGEETSETAGMP